jgi:hypothetical protein
VFANLFASLSSFRREAPFAAWVFGVTRRTIAARFKRRRHETVTLSEEEAEQAGRLPVSGVLREANPYEVYECNERIGRIQDAASNDLTSEQRLFFLLHHIENRYIQDIARQAARRTNAVKSRHIARRCCWPANPPRRLDFAFVGTISMFQPDPHEPISLFLREAERPAGSREVRQLDFELSSLGDRVPGRLLLPAIRPGPYPLIFAQHGAGGAKDAGYMDTACLPWVRGGAAVASVDFPLHGKRASPKLSERMLHLFQARSGLSPFEAELWTGFVRQAVVDLRRTIDALAGSGGRCPGIAADSTRHLLAFPSARKRRGSETAAPHGGGGIARSPRSSAISSPRATVLFVNARATRPSRASAGPHQAAGDPRGLWFDSTSLLPGVASTGDAALPAAPPESGQRSRSGGAVASHATLASPAGRSPAASASQTGVRRPSACARDQRSLSLASLPGEGTTKLEDGAGTRPGRRQRRDPHRGRSRRLDQGAAVRRGHRRPGAGQAL